jgi:mediator of RNA polymerase II transcription subunit 23
MYLGSCFANLSPEAKVLGLSQYLIKTATETNHSQLKLLLGTLNKMVNSNILSARLVCEQILSCEKLCFKNQLFWIECFHLIRRIIGGVDYKGVREIMKGCREKANSFPENLNSSVLPQMMALYEVLEYIFNRNSCLLPAYFIITEIQKPDNTDVHWVSLVIIAIV